MILRFPLFVGYTTLDLWFAAIDPSSPVFASLITEHGETHMNQRTDRMIAIISQPEVDLVHYCQLTVGELHFVNGEPFDTDHRTRLARAQQVWQNVKTWLISKNLSYREGTIAWPKNCVSWMPMFLIFNSQQQSI